MLVVELKEGPEPGGLTSGGHWGQRQPTISSGLLEQTHRQEMPSQS